MLARFLAAAAAAGATLLLVTPPGLAAQAPLPAPVERGLAALAKGDAAGAVNEWTATWKAAEDSAKRQNLAASLQNFADAAGTLRGHDVARVVDVTPNLKRVYILLRFDDQPLYLLLVTYRPERDWQVTAVNWHTDAVRVFPLALLEGGAPVR
ncbi:MAG TPA: hypothetical protein VNI61_11295 [Gemmatimonadales bacterium]|nr:hypothetical protein [Gemmatimonadales bacterium]